MAERSLIRHKEPWWSALKPQRQRLKDRLNLILLVVVFTACAASLIALQIALRIYDNMLYRESAKVLNLSSMVIENELRKIEDMSFLILADPTVQRLLGDTNATAGLYDRYQTHTRLQQILNAYAFSEEYIYSISLIDNKNSQISVGRGWRASDSIGRDELIAMAKEGGGRNIWVVPDEGGPLLMAVRSIRRIRDLRLDYMGLLMIRLDMPELISRLAESYPRVDTNLFIVAGDGKRVYSRGLELDWRRDIPGAIAGDAYGRRTFGGKKYFTAYIKSPYTGWTYLSIMPYEHIYQQVFWLRNALVVVFFAIFCAALWLGLSFAKSITRPIERLAFLIKEVEQGDFSLRVEGDLPESSPEEIRLLHRDFGIMLARINTLIQEEYRREILLKDTKYRALQAQINPHFLYNTLDSINWMAKAQRQTEISAMVEALGDLLRSAISKSDILTIREELGIVQSYIVIQKIRYEERLIFESCVDEGCLPYLIPKLSLQPLVENAVNYGLENMVGACRIKVGVAETGDGLLEITVEDDGPGMDPRMLDKEQRGQVRTKSSGIGLKNIDDRLKMVFGPAHGLELMSEPGRGTKVRISIPARTAL